MLRAAAVATGLMMVAAAAWAEPGRDGRVAAPEPAHGPAGHPAPVAAVAVPGERPLREPAFRVTNVAAADVLNVRDGPSPSNVVVGMLAPDARAIRITGPCRSGWCPVAHEAMSGWVNRSFLTLEEGAAPGRSGGRAETPRDDASAPRACLTSAARALLDAIEARFGPVRVVSTCRPGARIAGSGRLSRHASGNAVDFDAGSRKAAVLAWLLASHRTGGTMTYPGMDHIHVDIGPYFVSLAGRRHRAAPMAARAGGGLAEKAPPERMGLTAPAAR